MVEKLSRRQFIQIAALTGCEAVIGSQKVIAQKYTEQESAVNNLDREFIREAQKFGFDNLGYRISNAWQVPDGNAYIAYQGAILEKDSQGNIRPWNTLDQMHDLGLDDELAQGTFGVLVPKHVDFDFERKYSSRTNRMYETRETLSGISEEVFQHTEEATEKGFYPGMPTSTEKDYGAFTITRFQNLALQKWKEDNRIERVLVGQAARLAGIIPQEYLLTVPQLDENGEICIPTKTKWIGQASYYSHAGCMGCSPNQIMANGKQFNENAFTIAFMKARLGSKVKVTNNINGKSVIAEVTDWGNFERWGRIADLSKGVMQEIEGNDLTAVEITLLDCQ